MRDIQARDLERNKRCKTFLWWSVVRWEMGDDNVP